MEFTKKLLQTSQENGRAAVQMTVESDYNLPDYKPDMIRLVDRQGNLRIGELHIEAGQVTAEGVLAFQILYKCVEEGSLCSLKGEVPFQETIHMEGVQETDGLIVTGAIEDLTIGMINSRKLNVRALLELELSDRKEQQVELPTGMEGQAETLYEQKNVLQLVMQKKDICRLRNEILLPSNRPNIRELLWQSVQLRGLEQRIRTGEIELTGELLIHILYKGEEEEKQLQCMETTVALRERIECSMCEPDMVFKLDIIQSQFELAPQEDEDGELRCLLLEGVLEYQLRIWQEKDEQILSDAYSLQEQLLLLREPVQLQSLLVKNDSKFKLTDQVPLDNLSAEVLQICACEGEALLEESRIVSDGIEAEGIIKVKVLFITSSDEMPIGVAEGIIPFSQKVEADGIQPQDAYELHVGLDQMTVMLADNSQADIKAIVGLSALVFQTSTLELITEIESRPEDSRQMEESPGMIGYIVRDGDRLWDIAKKNHTTVEAVMQRNKLSNEQLNRGEKLLIVKQM